MSDTSGLSSRTPLAFFDPDSSCWRMSQATFLSDSTSSSLTLPASGSMRSGALYARPTLAPATSGPAFSSLPTPTASDSVGARNATSGRTNPDSKHHAGTTLGDVFWPLLRTPQAQVTDRTPADPQVGLIDQIVTLLPTPAAGNPNDGESPESWQARHDRHASKEEGATRSGLPLAIAVAALLPTPTTEPMSKNGHARNLGKEARLLPTPMARDHKGQPLPREGGDDLNMAVGRLLPTPDAANGLGGHERRGGARGDELLLAGPAKEVSRGASTDPPSPVTNSSSTDGILTLWTDEDD